MQVMKKLHREISAIQINLDLWGVEIGEQIDKFKI